MSSSSSSSSKAEMGGGGDNNSSNVNNDNKNKKRAATSTPTSILSPRCSSTTTTTTSSNSNKKQKVRSSSATATTTISNAQPPIFCWVTQGKTDHYATIVDPLVLAVLAKERKTEDGTSRNNVTRSGTKKRTCRAVAVGDNNSNAKGQRTELSRVLPRSTIEMEIKWCSTKHNQKVLVSSVKLEEDPGYENTTTSTVLGSSEGRGIGGGSSKRPRRTSTLSSAVTVAVNNTPSVLRGGRARGRERHSPVQLLSILKSNDGDEYGKTTGFTPSLLRRGIGRPRKQPPDTTTTTTGPTSSSKTACVPSSSSSSQPNAKHHCRHKQQRRSRYDGTETRKRQQQQQQEVHQVSRKSSNKKKKKYWSEKMDKAYTNRWINVNNITSHKFSTNLTASEADRAEDVVKSHTKIDESMVVRNTITTRTNNNSVLIEICDDDDDVDDVVENNTIKKESLASLQNKAKVEGRVIDSFFQKVLAKDAKRIENRMCFFETTFVTKLMDANYRYDAIKSWSMNFVPKGKDIFHMKKLFFPVRPGDQSGQGHWILTSIDLQEKRIDIYNSASAKTRSSANRPNQKYDDIAKKLFLYLQDEHNDKRGTKLTDDNLEWKINEKREHEDPQQTELHECGVFVCYYAAFLSAEMPLLFGQNDITQRSARYRIALSILDEKMFL